MNLATSRARRFSDTQCASRDSLKDFNEAQLSLAADRRRGGIHRRHGGLWDAGHALLALDVRAGVL
jgi:hypothetical protein